jgi:predicted DNA-binding transcriptional regulator AlpA
MEILASAIPLNNTNRAHALASQAVNEGELSVGTFLDIAELAAVLECSPSSVRRKMRVQPWLLPPSMPVSVRLSPRWREVDVLQWLQEQAEMGEITRVIKRLRRR